MLMERVGALWSHGFPIIPVSKDKGAHSALAISDAPEFCVLPFLITGSVVQYGEYSQRFCNIFLH